MGPRKYEARVATIDSSESGNVKEKKDSAETHMELLSLLWFLTRGSVFPRICAGPVDALFILP